MTSPLRNDAAGLPPGPPPSASVSGSAAPCHSCGGAGPTLGDGDEASIPCRSKDDDLTADSRGRSHLGKAALIAAVEIDKEGRPGRARLAVLADYSAEKIGAFVRMAVAPRSGLLTDGLAAY